MKKLIGFGLILAAMTGALMTSCDNGSTSTVEKVYNVAEVATLADQLVLFLVAEKAPKASGYWLVTEGKETNLAVGLDHLITGERLTLQEVAEAVGLTKAPEGLEDDLAAGRVAFLMILASLDESNLRYLVIWE